MYIDCCIDSNLSDEDIWISTIQLVNYDNLLTDGIIYDSSKVLTCYDDQEGKKKQTTVAIEVPAKSLSALSDTTEILFDRGLFYVLVSCGGEDADESEIAYAVVPDWQFIYSIGMPFVSKIAHSTGKECTIPKKFEEFVIVLNALKLAFEGNNFTSIATLWKKFLRFAGSGNKSDECGCN